MVHIFRYVPMFATFTVVCTASGTEAAPVTCPREFPDFFATQAECSRVVAALPSSQPDPGKECPDEAVQPETGADPGSSAMNGSGASVSLSGGSGFAGVGGATVGFLLTSPGTYMRSLSWLYIPPRFLDGIFRPPPCCHSL